MFELHCKQLLPEACRRRHRRLARVRPPSSLKYVTLEFDSSGLPHFSVPHSSFLPGRHITKITKHTQP
jgi:hypothetical protein